MANHECRGPDTGSGPSNDEESFCDYLSKWSTQGGLKGQAASLLLNPYSSDKQRQHAGETLEKIIEAEKIMQDIE